MNIAEQIRLKLRLKENSEVEYKSATGGFPKTEFWRSFSAFANTNGGTIVLGVKEQNHSFTPDGLSENLVAKYRKQFWDDAHNKSCVNIPLLVESDIEEIKKLENNRNNTTKTAADTTETTTETAADTTETTTETAADTTETTTETAADTTETTTETAADTTETTTETAADTTETIFRIIQNNPKVTTKEIASECGITKDGVAYHVKKLKLSGRIIRIGGSRNGGQWKIVKH